MRNLLIAIFAICLVAQPLAAQQENPPSMMERGVQQFLEGLLLEMEPAFESMQDFMEEMGPALTELMGQVEDWSAYELPEILDNGDIIFRRKTPNAPIEETPPQIEL